MALQFGEGPRLLPGAVAQNPRHRQFRVVIQNRGGNAAEVGEGLNVAFQECFCRLRRKRHDETVIRVRQVHRQVVGLPLFATDDHQRLAEVGLRRPRRMRQRNEHLAAGAASAART